MQRHPLIEEAKSELDVACEEVRRAERRIMALEEDFDLRLRAATPEGETPVDDAFRDLMRQKEIEQEDVDIDFIYDIHERAVERFCKVAAAAAVVDMVEDPRTARNVLRTMLFQPEEYRPQKVNIDKSLGDFAVSLKAYSLGENGGEAKQAVRDAWDRIESVLRECGRKI